MPGPAQTPFSLLSSSPISGATVDTLSIPTHGCSPRCSEPALHIALSSPECGAIASNSKLGKDEEASLNAAVKRLPLVRICHLSKACNLRPKEQSTENNNRKPALATIPDQSSTDTSAAQIHLQARGWASCRLHGCSVEPFWLCSPSQDCGTGHLSDTGSSQPRQGRAPTKGRQRGRHVQSARVDTALLIKRRAADDKTPVFLLVLGAASLPLLSEPTSRPPEHPQVYFKPSPPQPCRWGCPAPSGSGTRSPASSAPPCSPPAAIRDPGSTSLALKSALLHRGKAD